jgi:hypothetical protein
MGWDGRKVGARNGIGEGNFGSGRKMNGKYSTMEGNPIKK